MGNRKQTTLAFSDGASRRRAINATQNYSVLLKIALNLLKKEKTEKQGVKGKNGVKRTFKDIFLIKQKSLKTTKPSIYRGFECCDRDRIRTCDRLLRRQMLYPTELRDQYAICKR